MNSSRDNPSKKSIEASQLPSLVSQLEGRARGRLWTAKQWAHAAAVTPETLSRLKKRQDCDFTTLDRLASSVDMRLGLQAVLPKEMPAKFGREEEEKLLALCSAPTLDLKTWLKAGPRYFMAGVATTLASARDMDRQALLAVAGALYPGMTTVQMFEEWLKRSPLRPSRFLPMLRKRLGPFSAVLAAKD